ncbi:MAG: lysylphosphatidylglycerol synthase transmembrane domain-containing protein [Athalassotoga sp.]|uniref:lysylphosphatidylglycerol synthase transmembrane domain-containing protein n=1 Tax=Athalassotoga sp. TaxID=2022597 RepID=UPI003D00729C
MRKFIIYGLIIGIVSAVTIYLLNSFGGGINLKLLEDFFLKSWWGVLGVILLLISWITDAINTYILVRISKSRITFFQSIKATIISNFFGMITPSSVGGQPMQVVYMNKVGVSPGISTSIIVFKFIAWQGAIEVMAIFGLRRALILLGSTPSATSLAIIGFLISTVTIVLMMLFNFNKGVYNLFFRVIRKVISVFTFSKKLKPKTEKLLERFDTEIAKYATSAKTFSQKPHILIFVFFLSIISSGAGLMLVFPIVSSLNLLGGDLQSFLDILAVQALATLIIYYSPTPGSTGTAEGEFYLFYSAFIPSKYLATITIEWGILRYFLPLLIGFIVVMIESFRGMKLTNHEKDVIINEKSQ